MNLAQFAKLVGSALGLIWLWLWLMLWLVMCFCLGLAWRVVTLPTRVIAAVRRIS